MPGVISVLAGDDIKDKIGALPCVAPAERIPFHPALAVGKVRYVGASNYQAWRLMKAFCIREVNG